jgi:hypothetical protein
MALAKDRETLDFDVPGELRFTPKVHRRVRNSSISQSVPVGGKINRCAPGSRLRSFGKRKTRASRSIPLGTGLWFDFSSVERIRTTDLRVMSQNPESVPFVRRALQISQTDERWFKLAGHAAVVNRCSYSRLFTCIRQAPFDQKARKKN